MSDLFSWECPYCGQHATITDSQYSVETHFFNNNNKDKHQGILTTVIVCPNRHCKEFTIDASLYSAELSGGWRRIGKPILAWALKPKSKAKPYPEYIPASIRRDYEEACLILDLSPKASATLSRRCLQGMIRDYWKVKKKNLFQEINAIKADVESDVWNAIDAVRKIGNIGAHMEKDINLIIDVDPQEAGALVGLIELLFREWYIHRHERRLRLDEIKVIAASKKPDVSKQPGQAGTLADVKRPI